MAMAGKPTRRRGGRTRPTPRPWRRGLLASGPDGRLARRLFPAALMSDSKWRKVFAVLDLATPYPTVLTVKFIDVAQPQPMTLPDMRCPHDFMDTHQWGPVPLRAIEWLRVPIDLAPLLAGHGRFPLETDAGGTTVVGYRR